MVSVSVIVPVYNSAAYLRRCLDSLACQSLASMEVVLVDDGSTDASPAIMQSYADRYPGRFVIYTRPNGGQGSARNLGIQKSRGAYIGFVDSDDYVAPDMYKTMLAQAEATGSDFVECLYHCVEERAGGLRRRPTRGRIRAYAGNRDMLIDPQVSPWNKLFKRELLAHGVCFPEGLIYEDTAFFIKAVPYIGRACFVERRLVYYVLRPGSTMTANKSRRVADIFPVLDDILAFYKQRGLYDDYRDALEYFCVKILFCSSLGRIGRIPDAALRRELLDKTFAWVAAAFPAYRDNPYFANARVGLYIRLVRRGNSPLLARVLGRLMKG